MSRPDTVSLFSNKNTIEWEIPDRVSVCLMLVEKIGYTVLVKVKVEKKHWWNSSYKTFTTSSINPMEAVIRVSEFLEKHRYYIDHNTIEFGEKIGDPDFLNKSRQDKTDRSIEVLDELIDEADEEIIKKQRKRLKKASRSFYCLVLTAKNPLKNNLKLG